METSQVCFAHGVDVITADARRPQQAGMALVVRTAWKFNLADARYKMELTRLRARMEQRKNNVVRPAYKMQSKPRKVTGVVVIRNKPAPMSVRLLVAALSATERAELKRFLLQRRVFMDVPTSRKYKQVEEITAQERVEARAVAEMVKSEMRGI